MSFDASFNYADALGTVNLVGQLHELAQHPDKVFPDKKTDVRMLTPEQKQMVLDRINGFVERNQDQLRKEGARSHVIKDQIERDLKTLIDLGGKLISAKSVARPQPVIPEDPVEQLRIFAMNPENLLLYTVGDTETMDQTAKTKLAERILFFLAVHKNTFDEYEKLQESAPFHEISTLRSRLAMKASTLDPAAKAPEVTPLPAAPPTRVPAATRASPAKTPDTATAARPDHLLPDEREIKAVFDPKSGETPAQAELAKQSVYTTISDFLQRKDPEMAGKVGKFNGLEVTLREFFKRIRALHQSGPTESDYLEKIEDLLIFARRLNRDLSARDLQSRFQPPMQQQVFVRLHRELTLASERLEQLHTRGRRPSHLPEEGQITPRDDLGRPLPKGEEAKQTLYRILAVAVGEKGLTEVQDDIKKRGGVQQALVSLFQGIEELSRPGTTEVDFLQGVEELREIMALVDVVIDDPDFKEKIEEAKDPLVKQAYNNLRFEIQKGTRQLNMLHDTKRRPEPHAA